ncbi:MAG: hypothetical protein PHN72_00700 [Bacilli bacterium]|nr:hypothetical protein [Bacilli bacterium]
MRSSKEFYKACFDYVIENKVVSIKGTYIVENIELDYKKLKENAEYYFDEYAEKEEVLLYQKFKQYRKKKYIFDIYMRYANDETGMQKWLQKHEITKSVLLGQIKLYIRRYATPEEIKAYMETEKGSSIIPNFVKLFERILQNPEQGVEILKKEDITEYAPLRNKPSIYIKWCLDNDFFYPSMVTNGNANQIVESLINIIEQYEKEMQISPVKKSTRNYRHDDIFLKNMKEMFHLYASESPLFIGEYAKKNHVTVQRLRAYIEGYKKLHPEQYKDLERKREAIYQQKIVDFANQVKQMYAGIKFGIMEDNINRKYDVIDYLDVFPYTPYQFTSLLKTANISVEERIVVEGFLQNNKLNYKVDREKEISSEEYYQSGECKIVISRDVKKQIIEDLEKNGYGNYRSIYKAAIQRYIQRKMALGEYEIEPQKKLELK